MSTRGAAWAHKAKLAHRKLACHVACSGLAGSRVLRSCAVSGLLSPCPLRCLLPPPGIAPYFKKQVHHSIHILDLHRGLHMVVVKLKMKTPG